MAAAMGQQESQQILRNPTHSPEDSLIALQRSSAVGQQGASTAECNNT